MDTGPDTIKLKKLEYFCHSLQPPFCFSCCELYKLRLGYVASVLCVSPPGEHISLVICVPGNTYHGETHITVTPAQNKSIANSAINI